MWAGTGMILKCASFMTNEEKKIELNYDRSAFLELVMEMRDLQVRFFKGDRGVVAEAKKAEAKVDAFIKKIFHDAETSPTSWERRPPPIQQGGLF
jgi:hypothetical protein